MQGADALGRWGTSSFVSDPSITVVRATSSPLSVTSSVVTRALMVLAVAPLTLLALPPRTIALLS